MPLPAYFHHPPPQPQLTPAGRGPRGRPPAPASPRRTRCGGARPAPKARCAPPAPAQRAVVGGVKKSGWEADTVRFRLGRADALPTACSCCPCKHPHPEPPPPSQRSAPCSPPGARPARRPGCAARCPACCRCQSAPHRNLRPSAGRGEGAQGGRGLQGYSAACMQAGSTGNGHAGCFWNPDRSPDPNNSRYTPPRPVPPRTRHVAPPLAALAEGAAAQQGQSQGREALCRVAHVVISQRLQLAGDGGRGAACGSEQGWQQVWQGAAADRGGCQRGALLKFSPQASAQPHP